MLLLGILLSSVSFATAEIQLESSKIHGGGYYKPSMEENNGTIVITEEMIQKKHYDSVAKIFEDSPVSVVRHTAFGPIVDLRGSGERTISRVKVMIDGTPINPLEETHGTIPFDTIPVESISKIEIVPGTGTTKYGGGTTGGYINIHTKKDRQNNYITVNADHASYNTNSIGIAAGMNATKKLFVYVGEAYQRKDGYRKKDHSDRNNFLGGFDYQINTKHRIKGQGNLYREDLKSTTEVTHEELKQDRRKAGEDTKIEMDRDFASLDYEYTPSSNFTLRTNVNRAHFTRDVAMNGKQTQLILPNAFRFEMGIFGDLADLKPVLQNFESTMEGKFKEKNQEGKVDGEWKYNQGKGHLQFGYSYNEKNLNQDLKAISKPFTLGEMGYLFQGDPAPHPFEDYAGKVIDADTMWRRIYKDYGTSEAEIEQALVGRKERFDREKVDVQNYNTVDAFKDTHALYLLNDYKITPKFNLRAGLRWEHSEYGADRKNRMLFGIHNAKKSYLAAIAAMYGFLSDYEKQKLVEGKLNYVHMNLSLKETRIKDSSDNVGGEVGFSYQYNKKGSIFFRYERGFLSPLPSQLTNKDFLTGIYYPSHVKSEKVDTFEIGVKHSLWNNTHIEANTFFSLTKDEITNMRYNANNHMNMRWAYANISKTRRFGFELNAEHIFDKLKIRESFSYVDAKIAKDTGFKDYYHSGYVEGTDKKFAKEPLYYKKGQQVPLVSKIKVTVGAEYQFTDKLSLGGNYNYVSGYDTREPSEGFQAKIYKVKGHGTLDLFGRYYFTDYAYMRFGVNNVLGEKYNLREDSHYAVPAPKQNYYAGFSYKF